MTTNYPPKKPKGYFKYIFAVDSETTGFNKGTGRTNPSIGNQAISWGIIVADAETLIPIEKLYLEVQWNDESRAAKEQDPTFGTIASDIHGLTFAYLEEHGIPEEEAVLKIAELIVKYWGPEQMLHCLGHNVEFDIAFLDSMMLRYGIELRFSARQVDSNSIGFATVESYTSDDLFDSMGLPARDEHNSLQDIEYTLESMRRIRVLWNDFVKVKAHETG